VRAHRDLEGRIPHELGDVEGALAGCDGPVRLAAQPEILTHEREDQPEPALIGERLSQLLGLGQVLEDPPEISERLQRVAEIEPEINGLLDRLTAPREVPESLQRLLEVSHGLPVSRPCRCLRSGPT
jgi:hypothetical protein